MDLPGLGVHQHRSAMSAAIINGVRAGDEHRRRTDRVAIRRILYDFEIFAHLFAHLSVLYDHHFFMPALRALKGSQIVIRLVRHDTREPHLCAALRARRSLDWYRLWEALFGSHDSLPQKTREPSEGDQKQTGLQKHAAAPNATGA